jgi:DNA-binding transcriptional ArsR family regulator
MADTENLVQIFKLLSDETRLKILKILKQKSLCVTELTSRLGITCSATSQHLKLLRQAGLVKTIKRGLYVYNFPDETKITVLKKSLDELFNIE